MVTTGGSAARPPITSGGSAARPPITSGGSAAGRSSSLRSAARPPITSGGSAAGVPDVAAVRDVVAAVPDPELPVITIAELGVLRDVSVDDNGYIEVVITPTYSGCPAMDAIRGDISDRLAAHGWLNADIRLELAPAWTTDWITTSGREALREYGIAPPNHVGSEPVAVTISVRCPNCGSPDTHEISRFGSTACKALWTCHACREPFDHIKAI